MPKAPSGPRKEKRGRPFGPRRSRKVCEFCVDKGLTPEYKNVQMMEKYITDRGKIKPRRMTGACAKHQRKITVAVKRAREMALVPYARD